MTLEDFFKELHDFGTSINLSVDELYTERTFLHKINQDQDYKPNFVKNGIEIDNSDCYIVFLAVFQPEENQIRYMNCEQHIRYCNADEVGLEQCKQSILDGIKLRKEDKNQCRLDSINEDF